MRVLFIYPNIYEPTGYLHTGIGVLSACLKEAGHTTALFDTTFYDLEKDANFNHLDWRSSINMIQYKDTKLEEKIGPLKTNVIGDFIKKIESFKPDLIAATCVSQSYPVLLKLLETVKNYNIPVIVGGPKASISPRELLENTAIDYVGIGECEEALLELVSAMDNEQLTTHIPNIWAKDGRNIIENPVRPLKGLNDLPFPDWEIFGEIHQFRPFKGEVVRMGCFEFSRGCPFECSFCITSFYHKLYNTRGGYRRVKDVDRMIAEIKYFKDRYNITLVRFVDETLFTMSYKKVKDFADKYKKEIDLPFVCLTRVESLTEEKLEVLGATNCCMHITIGVENGSEYIRQVICNKKNTNEQILNAARLIHKYGMGINTLNMIGLPEETREDIFKTIKINREIDPIVIQVTYFYPFEGTPLRDYCIEHTILDEEKDKFGINYFVDSVLKMPQISQKELQGLKKTFQLYCKFPRYMFPIIRISEHDNLISNIIFKLLVKIFRIKWAS